MENAHPHHRPLLHQLVPPLDNLPIVLQLRPIVIPRFKYNLRPLSIFPLYVQNNDDPKITQNHLQLSQQTIQSTLTHRILLQTIILQQI